MTHQLKSYLVCTALFLNSNLIPAQGAEDEFVLLTIEGNLIGLIDVIDYRMDDPQQAARLIRAYHLLLTAEVRAEVESLHEEMLELVPGFEVAYTAADSAEFSHLMSEMDIRLAAIQDIHGREYTQDVIALLTEAYQLLLPTFGDDQ